MRAPEHLKQTDTRMRARERELHAHRTVCSSFRQHTWCKGEFHYFVVIICRCALLRVMSQIGINMKWDTASMLGYRLIYGAQTALHTNIIKKQKRVFNRMSVSVYKYNHDSINKLKFIMNNEMFIMKDVICCSWFD